MEHLVILRPPFLRRVLDGSKRVECRLAARRIAPYRQVRRGDMLWLKLASGPIKARTRVAQTWHFALDEMEDRGELVRRFDGVLGAPGWLGENLPQARYATFVRLGRVEEVPDVWIDKRDRRGWVVLKEGLTPYLHS